MSRVTYILGAGASYGERVVDERGNLLEFSRGLPIVNELAAALRLLKTEGRYRPGVVFESEEANKKIYYQIIIYYVIIH
jgi:hypothetical protein